MANTKKRGNGDGSIYFSDAKKKWVGQVTTGRDTSGKLRRRTVYGKTKTEVKEKITGIKNEVMHQTYVAPDRITVAELLQTLIDEDRALNLISDASYTRKIATLARVEKSALADLPIQSVKEQHVQAYLCSITSYSNSIIHKDYGLLQRCFRDAVHRSIIVKNPMDFVRKPKSDKKDRKVRALTKDEQRRLVEVLHDHDVRYKPQLLLMLYTGMRMGEINALDVHDVNLTFNVITIRRTITRDAHDHAIIGKTTKTYEGERTIPITPTVKPLLAQLLADYVPNRDDLLFYDYRKQSPLTTSQVNCVFQRLIKKHSILDPAIYGTVSQHSLRHTYATRCIEAGMSAKVLQTLLGHTDVTTTLNTYCDAFAEYQAESISKVDAYLAAQQLIG